MQDVENVHYQKSIEWFEKQEESHVSKVFSLHITQNLAPKKTQTEKQNRIFFSSFCHILLKTKNKKVHNCRIFF